MRYNTIMRLAKYSICVSPKSKRKPKLSLCLHREKKHITGLKQVKEELIWRRNVLDSINFQLYNHGMMRSFIN